MAASSTSLEPNSPSVRLHISPFNPSLLHVYLPGPLQSLASDISYHNILTFPEKDYGFVTMPKDEAAKMAKKLKGAILKGEKVTIQEARPPKRKAQDDGDQALSDRQKRKLARKERKADKARAATDNNDKLAREKGELLQGHQIEQDRKIARGWTDPEPPRRKDKKKSREKGEDKNARNKERSKYTSGPELLFKTQLPHMSKKATAKQEIGPDQKRKKKTPKHIIVHEFEHNQKHVSFLKKRNGQSEPQKATEYIKGMGWVDGNGNVVEELKSNRAEDKATATAPTSLSSPPPAKESERVVDSSSDLSCDSSDLSSDSDSDSDSPSQASQQTTKIKAKTAANQIESLQEETTTPPNKEAIPEEGEKNPARHPLETLFKRSAGSGSNRPTPINTSFSFFDQVNEQSGGEDESNLPTEPQTPFPQHVEKRHISRSSAPTPDTAVANRRFSFSRGVVDSDDQDTSVGDDNDEEGDEKYGNAMINHHEDDMGGATGTEESAFSKWFWENRGENNRRWKRRRREAMKEKRQRENRKLGRRVV